MELSTTTPPADETELISSTIDNTTQLQQQPEVNTSKTNKGKEGGGGLLNVTCALYFFITMKQICYFKQLKFISYFGFQ